MTTERIAQRAVLSEPASNVMAGFGLYESPRRRAVEMVFHHPIRECFTNVTDEAICHDVE